MTGLTPEREAAMRLRKEAMLNRGEPLAEDILAVLDALDAAEKENARITRGRMGGGDDYRIAAVSEARERMHVAEDALATLKAGEERLSELAETVNQFAYFDDEIRWAQEGGAEGEAWPAVLDALEEARNDRDELRAREERLDEAIRRALDVATGWCAPIIAKDWDVLVQVLSAALAEHEEER